MCTLNHKPRPHPEVVDTELGDGEMALLHLESKTYYSLNVTGMHIWLGLKQGLTLKEISQRLQAEFEVEGTRPIAVCLRLWINSPNKSWYRSWTDKEGG